MIERAIALLILTGLFFIFTLLAFFFRHLVYQFLCILVLMVLQGVLYLYLNAEFLGAIQVIVYAGAVLIMFLFTLFLFPEEELKHLKIDLKNLKYSSFLPVALFIFLLLSVLVKGIPESYQPRNIYFDLKEISNLLFNEYWLAIFLLAFILSFPMVALYVFFKREEKSGSS
ncbi:MAG: NADH-quinone oxidoreductase subunit J [Caldimicrobium sp.]